MFYVSYFCPSQSPLWQSNAPYGTLEQAVSVAQFVRPPRGEGRVVYRGREVYRIWLGPDGQVYERYS